MDTRSQKGYVCYLVCKNAILAPGCEGGWLMINGYLGGE